MGLNENQKRVALKIWNDYKVADVKFYNANKIITPEEIDKLRWETIPDIRIWIDDYFGGEVALEEFKTAIDGLNKRNPYWGFKGINGQMFFNMLTKTCIQHNMMNSLDKILKESLKAPSNIEEATGVIDRLRIFTEKLGEFYDDRRIAPKVGSIPFFISYFWQIEDPNKYPVYYTSAINAFKDLGIWAPARNVVQDYLSYYEFSYDLQELISSKEGKSVSHWDVEHAFWFYAQKTDEEDEIITSPIETDKHSKEGVATLPESYIPPVVSILPRLAVNDEEIAKICQKIGRGIEKVFEDRLAILLQMLGYEVEWLGQGYGRVPDGIAISPEYHYAIIYDAKVRKDGYTMGIDERAIKEYIWGQGEPLKRKGIRNIYFLIISSKFSGDHDDVIRRLKIETDVREVLLVEVSALVTLLEGKLKSTSVTLGPDGFQNLLASSGVLTREDMKAFLGI